MKGLEFLPITEDQKRQIVASVTSYKNEQIYFSVLQVSDNEITIRVLQKEKSDDHYLTRKELNALVKSIFSECLAPRTVHSRPIPYVKDKIEDYTVEKIRTDMEELGLSIRNLIKILNIDKASLTRVLSPGYQLSLSERAMFYYLFKYLRSEGKTSNS